MGGGGGLEQTSAVKMKELFASTITMHSMFQENMEMMKSKTNSRIVVLFLFIELQEYLAGGRGELFYDLLT